MVYGAVMVILLIVGVGVIIIDWLRLKSRIYICNDTEKAYIIRTRCKSPETKEWYIVYQDTEDKEYYVMKKEDFFNNFQRLK